MKNMSGIENQETAALKLNQEAEFYLSQGDFDKAYATSLQALELVPDFAPVSNTIGKIMEKIDALDAAITWYKKAIEKQPNLAENHANLGSVYVKQQQWDKAIASYQKATKLEANFASAYRALAEIYHQIDKPELAASCQYKAFILKPEWATDLEYLNLGKTLLTYNRKKEAIACFIQSLQIKPDYIDVYHQIAKVLEKQNYIDAAFKCRFSKKLPKNLLKKFCQLTGDWQVITLSAKTITRIDIYPSSQINLLLSQTINKNIHRAFKRCQIDSEEAFLVILENGRAWGDNFNSAIITSDNKLVSDISSGVPELIISSSRLPHAINIDGTVAFLSTK